ncbi:Cobyrinic acid A,C-diamide synthase [Rhodospirillaceae bacterium LM-1]|nr:Cobyrinic acid A,C-diamide synthase [Rhodospirillaceae bacterium LM-1]
MASRLVISAAHKSSGKTTITLGLLAALSKRGLRVQPFKKGPDYIDPLWHKAASGRASWNLDFYSMSHGEMLALAARQSQDADLALVEGNKGLFDGMDTNGTDDTAALAKLLRAPVVLVIDARGTTRGIAPLLKGYLDFDPGLQIAGVILNQVAGPRHEGKLRAAIARYLPEFPVLGAIPRETELEVAERHLGLVPANEQAGASELIAMLASSIEAHVDLDRLLEIARRAEDLPMPATLPARPESDLRIAIAQDSAFGFYYPDDLEAFAQNGAQLVPFDTMTNYHLPPDIDGLFIGGGFPETHMRSLSANHVLRSEINAALRSGLPCHAECGGLMYLAQSIRWGANQADMVGFIKARVVMQERPVGRGYVRLKDSGKGLWQPIGPSGASFAAHEFHHSRLEDMAPGQTFAFNVERGVGIQDGQDGLVVGNMMASYAHLRSVVGTPWVSRFVDFIRSRRR